MNGYILSGKVFRFYVRLTGVDKRIIPGEYNFGKFTSLAVISHKILKGQYGMEQRMIVIPEGTNSTEIAAILKNFYGGNFKEKDFIEKAKSHEGYLFPDTYYPFQSTSTSEIIKVLTDNFENKTEVLKREALSKNLNWSDIIILASLLEGEGKTVQDRKIISGILQERLKEGVALQVDATFKYINGKSTKELTSNDLKIDSPYNTYLYPGFPPTPISNPGLETIEAAINPTLSDYQYFLTGNDGQMHYAKTFEEHVKNKKMYLE